MRWQGRRQSDNVEDRRGSKAPLAIGGGLGAVVIVVLYLIMGGNPNEVLQQVVQQPTTETKFSPREEELAAFTKVVLADTEDVWDSVYRSIGDVYEQPRLVLFSGSTSSGCGFASAASGPFYCPPDKRIYIDLSFFDELQQRFSVEGEFAMAYVIAHEVGHHIQELMGTTNKLQAMRSGVSETEYNKLSVKLELQADFLAGVWAHHAQRQKNILEEGDIASALAAANAIGDDRLQQAAGKTVNPDAFTHGTSKQRMYWFKKGFTTGDIKDGNTFASTEME
ncbi:KPN_02809 family neutral zinc metallopeptidase [Sediminibacterium goheungense]|uniref:Metalloprotease n=1 Tax=Sediminibacterium goheungense TaxID=1086393 RepID=A0A4R6J3Q7_9BACT|nr:neutral zinc metallopeptidase [Sediminibacterium goheungense]TDO29411.1 hypothetical protein BC659_1500 [Sediminibacterium goheungense]